MLGVNWRTGLSAHRYLALDSLRGVCACMIVLLHLTTSGAINRSAFVQHGFLFVDFFFVLSGFVIAASYGEKLTQGFGIGKFMGLRLGRIYPLHLAVLAAFLGFEILFAGGFLGSADRQPFAPPNDIPMFVANLFLLQTFAGPDAMSWNGPSWSIAVEVWTYFIYAMLFRFARSALIPIAVLLAVACCITLYLRSGINVVHDGALARCLYGFSLGVICYRLHQWAPRLRHASAVEGAVVVLVVAMVTVAGPLSLAIPFVFFGAVFIFAAEQGAVSRLLRRAPFLLLGTLSYSIYMIHDFIELRIVNVLALVSRHHLVVHDGLGNHVGGSPLFGDFMSIATLSVTVAVAWLSYRWIEAPAKQWSRKLVLRRPVTIALSPMP